MINPSHYQRKPHMTLKSLFRPLLLALTLLPLCACSSLFKPDRMTIEYDEEVKLHDGEMIWVHITRHYILSSAALGDPGGLESSYKPKEVEISWDTGFEGVGRKSVFFRNVMAISKVDSQWYVVGSSPQTSVESIGESISCNKLGIKVGKIGCMVSVNINGFVEPEANNILRFNEHNILYPVGIKDWGSVPRPLDKKQVSWKEKIVLEVTQSEDNRQLGKPLTKEESL